MLIASSACGRHEPVVGHQTGGAEPGGGLSETPDRPAHKSSGQPGAVAKQERAPASTTQRTETPGAVNFEARVKEIVTRHGTKQRCNDLNGCPMVGVLRQLGPAAAPAIQGLFVRSSGDAFWRLELLRTLGYLRAPESLDFLLSVAETKGKLMMRVRAMMAVARLGESAAVRRIEALVSTLDPTSELGLLLASGYALAGSGQMERGRALIKRHFKVPEQTLRWDHFRPGAYAAGQLRLVSLREGVQALVAKADPFTRREAVQALGRMRDRAAVDTLIDALGDQIPGVRAEALKALKTLTGARHRESQAAWRRWRARHPDTPEADPDDNQ